MIGQPEPGDDLSVMLGALGSLIGWQGASYVPCPPRDQLPVVARTWWSADGAPGDVANGVPVGTTELDPAVWDHQRVLWRGGQSPDGTEGVARSADDRALAVPVWQGGEMAGVLTFVGPTLREPTEAELPLFEGVAGMLSRSARLTDSTTRGPDGAGNPWERAMALVDVFAFTVRVSGGTHLEWRYFGPNSAAVFGTPVAPGASLIALIEQHAHAEDLVAVRQLEQAALAGQPLEVEIRIAGGDGVERWVSWRSVPRRTEGVLHVDGVATDVSSRHSLGRSRRDLEQANEEYARQVDLRRRHALAIRDANDNVLQRIFAAGLRLQILRRKLDDVEAHAASTIAFQLDQATTDLRELILDLNAVIGDLPDSGR